MTMVYLANVKTFEDAFGMQFSTPHACVTLDNPTHGQPNYFVMTHWGAGRSCEFPNLADALDEIARRLKQSEPA